MLGLSGHNETSNEAKQIECGGRQNQTQARRKPLSFVKSSVTIHKTVRWQHWKLTLTIARWRVKVSLYWGGWG